MTEADRLQRWAQRTLRQAQRMELRAAIRRDRRENPGRYGVNIPEVMLATLLLIPVVPVVLFVPESLYWLSVVPAAGGVVYAGSRSKLIYLLHLDPSEEQTAPKPTELEELQAKPLGKDSDR